MGTRGSTPLVPKRTWDARCWPSAGLRGGSLCRRTFSGWCVVACRCGCTEDRGSLSRLTPPVPGSPRGRGHTCRAPPRPCPVCNATSPSVKCQAGTHAAYPVQQRLRVHAVFVVLPHWRPSCSDGTISNSAVTRALVAGRAVP